LRCARNEGYLVFHAESIAPFSRTCPRARDQSATCL
jgi:hypothetical protein